MSPYRPHLRFNGKLIFKIFIHCHFLDKKLVWLEVYILKFRNLQTPPEIFPSKPFWGVKMCDKMAISAYILKIVEKDPFLKLQMRAKEVFNRHHFFFTNKQDVKIKLMQNETNLWSIFLVKTKYW